MRPFITLVALLVFSTPAFAQRNLKKIPNPDPELERKSFILAPGVEVNLFASDPRIAKPIQMNFDPQGRLWIASSEVYPHIKPGQKANDKILVLEDKNGDGKADKTTVFASGLLIPTGVEPGDGGAYVANSTELLHFTDTNGDGKADKKRIVLSGFGTEDTHHILHTLRWGPEGFLYMNQSIYIHSHIETPYGVRRLNAGGIWRFRPETLQLKVYARGWVNPWGHQLNAFGQSFVTDGAGGEGINYLVPGASYVTAHGAPRILRGLNPGSPKYCGLEIVGGRHLPKDWQGNILTNDFRGNRVCRYVISEDGSGYTARQMPDLIKTKHVAFRPIDIKMGPDGAIYIADWYNPIIQHGEVDFRDPRRDHTHGRIWRVTFKNRKPVKRPNIVKATVAQLLDMQKSPEMWTRQQAKRVLKERGRKKVLTALRKWTASQKDDQLRLEALWIYQSLRAVEPKLLAELTRSKDHRIRAAATRIIGYWLEPGQVEPLKVAFRSAKGRAQTLTEATAIALLTPRVTDTHPRVRMEAVRVLGRINSQQSIDLAIRALDKPVDTNLDYALWLTVRELKDQWLPRLKSGKTIFGGDVEKLTFAARAVGGSEVIPPLIAMLKTPSLQPKQRSAILRIAAELGGPNELKSVFETATGKNQPEAQRAALLNALADAAAARRVRPAGSLQRIGGFFRAKSPAVRIAALRCAGGWRMTALQRDIAAIVNDKKVEAPVRMSAIAALGRIPGQPSRSALLSLSARSRPAEVRQSAVVAMCNLDLKLAAIQAVKLLDANENREYTSAVVNQFLSRRGGPAALAAALNSRKIPNDTAILALRTVSGSGRKFPGLEAALKKAGGVKAQKKLTKQELDVLVAAVDKSGDANRGEAVFRRKNLNCLKCHAVGGAGGRVGPDLISLGASAQVDYLIESLLEPNKKVKENYQTLIVVDDNGKVFTGVKVRQTDTSLILRDAEDKEIAIPLKSIDIQKNGASIMPAGLTAQLTRQEIVDLVKFLSQLGKIGKFAVSRKRVVRTWRVLVANRASHFRLRRTGYHTAASDDPQLTWSPAYSRVEGSLPLTDLNEFRLRYLAKKGYRGHGFVRFFLKVTQPGDVCLKFNSPTGLMMWLGTSPKKVGSTTTLKLTKGTHRITLAVDLKTRKESLQVELVDVPDSKAVVNLVGGK